MTMADMYPDRNAPGSIFTSQNSSASFTFSHETGLGVSEFFDFNDWTENGPEFFPSSEGYGNLQNPIFMSNNTVVNSTGTSISSNFHDEGIINRDNESGKEKKEIRDKVAFRTKSQIDILDDGFKWRKYGKKMVKNSPNPRNYFKCSVEGCSVKKRVERDKDDSLYVVTTYEGIHNHQDPYL